MAAYAALVSLMHIIHDIQHHHSPPIAIENQQVESLSQIIASLQQFLEGHTSSVTETDEADPLESRIAHAAYAVEAVIRSHILNRIGGSHQHQSYGIIRWFFNYIRQWNPTHHDDQINLYKDLQRVIEDMESIKKLTMEIDVEKVAGRDQWLRSSGAAIAPSGSFSNMQIDSITVLSDDVINEVMENLASGRPDRHVIPIVGMGGIGKTTLARSVYSQPFVKEHFDIRAWATVSEKHNIRKILCELSQATNLNKEKMEEKSEDELGTELYRYLFGRRYLIVMDDMWTIDPWDTIQCFFPNNGNGSRVLVTTRLSPLSSQLNSSYSLHMKFLDKGSSWDLFSKTVFGEESYPLELEKIGKKIVENCRGLPLSIVVVGGILKKMDRSRGCWESIGKNLTSVVNLENNKHCLRLLGMSYKHLPAYLKPCFLCMGVFEEDYKIRVSTLIKLWVCEGILKPTKDVSLEETAKGFLRELIDRNLILIHELGSTGNVKYCKIHDLLRDFCLNEAHKDGFYHVVGRSSPRGINTRHRVVVPGNSPKHNFLHDLRAMPYFRSVIFEYERVPWFESFRFPREFHSYDYKLRYYDEESYLNTGAFQIVNLRRLAIEPDKTFWFNLYWNLHTLILWCSRDSTAPVEIWRMPQLRRVEFVGIRVRVFLPEPPSDAVVMKNLEVLKGLVYFKVGEEMVERIPNIKKLELRYSCRDDHHEGYFRLGKMESLRELESLHVSGFIDLRRDAASLHYYELAFPHSLKKLTLASSNFDWNDVVEKIGSLPFLEKLKLWGGCFGTGKWEVTEGQFPCLKYLLLDSCGGLKTFAVQNGSSVFPRLEQLVLIQLDGLEGIPLEIGDVPTLQKVRLYGCRASAVKSAKVMLEEQVELQGDELAFDVEVQLAYDDQQLLRLAGPNFKVLL